MKTLCAHCERPATETVPELPGRVCVAHATEYWTSLLAYVKKERLQNAEAGASASAKTQALYAAPPGDRQSVSGSIRCS